MTQISPHFSLKELTVTSAGVDNTPDAKQIAALKRLCDNVLEPIREHFKRPVTINSGFRSAAVNKKIGGAATSQHSFGEAADIEIKGVPNQQIYDFIKNNLEFDQLIAEKLSRKDGSAGWIHVSYRLERLRKECLSFDGSKYKAGFHFID